MSNPTTQKLHVCGPNLRDQSQGSFVVHAVGCQDAKRLARRDPAVALELRSYPEGQEFSSLVEVAEYVYDNGIMTEDETGADYLGDFHFAPCVTLPVEVTEPERSYASSEMVRIYEAGPSEGEDFFRLQVTGNGASKHVNITPDQLAAISELLS